MNKKILIISLLSALPVFSWEFIGPGDSTQITNTHCFGKGHILAFVTKTQNNDPLLFCSRNYGNTWDSITNSGLPRHLERILDVFEYNNKLYCSPLDESLYFSTDKGNTWKKDTLIFCGANRAFSHVAKDSILLIGTYCFFARSTDYGKSWQNYIDMPWLEHEFGDVNCMMAFRDVVYAGTQYGIFASKDWGLTWEKRGFNYNGADGATITSLCRIDTVFLMSSYAALFRSYELGSNENSWIYTFDTERVMFLRVDDNSNIYVNDYYAGKSVFYFSSDTGKTYQPFSISIPEKYSYNINSDDKYVYVMGEKGIFRNLKTDSPTGITKEKSHKKSVNIDLFALKNKIVKFSIKQPTAIEINFYKPNGRKVFSYINNLHPQGQLQMDLKQMKISAGLYIVNVKTAHDIQTNIITIK